MEYSKDDKGMIRLYEGTVLKVHEDEIRLVNSHLRSLESDINISFKRKGLVGILNDIKKLGRRRPIDYFCGTTNYSLSESVMPWNNYNYMINHITTKSAEDNVSNGSSDKSSIDLGKVKENMHYFSDLILLETLKMVAQDSILTEGIYRGFSDQKGDFIRSTYNEAQKVFTDIREISSHIF